MEIVFLSMFFIGVYMNALGLIQASWLVLIKPFVWFICWCIFGEVIAEFTSEGSDNDDNAA